MIHLNDLDVYSLINILKKMPAKVFIRTVRSCKTLKKVFESTSTWQIMFPGATLFYLTDSKFFTFIKEHNSQMVPSKMTTQDVSLFSFTNITLTCCSPDFFHHQVLPEIGKMRGIERIELGYKLDEEDLRSLMEIVAQPVVKYKDCHYSETNECLRSIRNIEVSTTADTMTAYWQSLKVFQLVRDRETVTIQFPKTDIQLIRHFVQSWLKGRDVGVLNKLVYSFENTQMFREVKVEVMRQIAIEPSLQDLIYALNEIGGTSGSLGSIMSSQQILTRNPRYGSRRLHLQFTDDSVIFQFIE